MIRNTTAWSAGRAILRSLEEAQVLREDDSTMTPGLSAPKLSPGEGVLNRLKRHNEEGIKHGNWKKAKDIFTKTAGKKKTGRNAASALTSRRVISKVTVCLSTGKRLANKTILTRERAGDASRAERRHI